MNSTTKTALFVLRLGMGWVFFYAGISKIIAPAWSAAGYLSHATTFSGFFNFLTDPSILPFVNFANEWGLLLIGISLIFGLWVKWSSLAGIVLMVLYWLPILHFPYAGTSAYLVDDHIIYLLVFILFIAINAGKYWGIDSRWSRA